MKKIINSENLYIIYFCLMSVCFLLRYFELPEYANNILIVVTFIAIVILFISWIKNSFSKKEIIIQVIIMGVSILAYYCSGCQYEYIILEMLAISCSKNVNLKKVAKYTFFLIFAIFIIYMILIALGIIENEIYVKYDKFGNEYKTYNFGIGHANTIYYLIFSIIALYVYAFFEKIKVTHIILIEIICIIFYFFTYSRTGIIMVSFLLIATLVLKLLPKKEKNRKIFKTSIKIITLICIPALFIFTYLFSTVFYDGNIFNFINNLITSRLDVAHYYIEYIGIDLLPQNYEITVVFDNVYAFIMVTLGYGITCLICCGYVLLINQLWKEKKYIEILLIIAFALYGFSEKMVINVFRNISILFFQFILYKKINNIEESNKKKFYLKRGKNENINS